MLWIKISSTILITEIIFIGKYYNTYEKIYNITIINFYYNKPGFRYDIINFEN